VAETIPSQYLYDKSYISKYYAGLRDTEGVASVAKRGLWGTCK
jgi:hypothetical protein